MLLRVEAVRCGLELIEYSRGSGLQPSEQTLRLARGSWGVWHCCRGSLVIDIELVLGTLVRAAKAR